MNDHRPCDLLITGGLVLTLDGADRVLRDGAIAVVGRRIAEIGPTPTSSDAGGRGA
jgi:5-methylthioadenosine/S-adenosylhomocysteine deaminase